MTADDLGILGKQAARSARQFSAIGALLVLGALGAAVAQLFSVELKIKNADAELRAKRAEAEDIRRALESYRRENSRLNAEVEAQKKRFSELKERFRMIQEDFNEAVNAINNRDYGTSLEKLRGILKADPENEVALYYAAHTCYRLGRFQDAIDLASRAVKEPGYFDPYVPMVCSYAKMGDRRFGVDKLKEVLNARLENYSLFASRKRDLDELCLIPEYQRTFWRHREKLEKIQFLLQQLGYYSCPQCQVDGLAGKRTREAVGDFLRQRGITTVSSVDGIVKQLESAAAPASRR